MFQQETESEGVQPNHNNNMPNSISEEPINQLPSGPDQLSLPESKPEICGAVQPNVNPGGSAHQQLFTEAQIGSADHLKYYRSFHNAAKRGDWKSAKSFIEKDPNALTARITVDSKTVFHVAAIGDQWEFILKLLELVSSPESIAVQDQDGMTVLHYVAQAGSLKTAKALVQKNAVLPQIGNNRRVPPLLHSIFSESKELVWYLSLTTRVDLSLDSTAFILRTLILSGYNDIALYFVRKYPDLALAQHVDGDSLLYWLATNPSHFFSGSNLGLIERWIYKCVEIKYPSTHSDSVIVNMKDSTEGFPALQPRSLANRVLQWIKRLLWKAIVQLAPFVNMVRDAKLNHECAVELVNHVCTQLSSMSFQEIEAFLTNPNPNPKSNILDSAIKCGIEEIVMTLLLQFPDLINVRVLPFRNILQAAIEYRQENIVNVIKEMSTTTTKRLGSYFIESKVFTLHLAGKLAPAIKLFSVSGASLQMQRELQWFKVSIMSNHFNTIIPG